MTRVGRLNPSGFLTHTIRQPNLCLGRFSVDGTRRKGLELSGSAAGKALFRCRLSPTLIKLPVPASLRPGAFLPLEDERTTPSR